MAYPPVTSKSKAAGTGPYVESSIKQQSRADICLYICGKPGKEGICARICVAGGGGGKASRTSKLHVISSVHSMWYELGKKPLTPLQSAASSLSARSYSQLNLGHLTLALFPTPPACVCAYICVCMYTCVPYRSMYHTSEENSLHPSASSLL